MSIIRLLSNTWRNLVRRASVESDLDAELRAYVDLSAGQKMKSGMSPAEARRAALIESGGVEQVKERVRDVRAGNLLETVLRDFRFGARMLAKNPAFTAAAVIMLALGIGANTAVFSVVNAVLLRGLPYSEPDRIVALYEMRLREHDLQGLGLPSGFPGLARAEHQLSEHGRRSPRRRDLAKRCGRRTSIGGRRLAGVLRCRRRPAGARLRFSKREAKYRAATAP